jgi:DNA-binding transcriptional ArsR family regulator
MAARRLSLRVWLSRASHISHSCAIAKICATILPVEAADAPTPLPLNVIERVADRFRLLSDPTRLRLVNELHASGELTVGELVARLEISYASASKQLALLRAHSTVARRREGTKVYYRIIDPSLDEVCNVVCKSLREHWATWGVELEAALEDDQ